MNMVDIIQKKKDGKKLSKDEIRWFIDGYVAGDIPDCLLYTSDAADD